VGRTSSVSGARSDRGTPDWRRLFRRREVGRDERNHHAAP
jgi:hypothetical protein